MPPPHDVRASDAEREKVADCAARSRRRRAARPGRARQAAGPGLRGAHARRPRTTARGPPVGGRGKAAAAAERRTRAAAVRSSRDRCRPDRHLGRLRRRLLLADVADRRDGSGLDRLARRPSPQVTAAAFRVVGGCERLAAADERTHDAQVGVEHREVGDRAGGEAPDLRRGRAGGPGRGGRMDGRGGEAPRATSPRTSRPRHRAAGQRAAGQARRARTPTTSLSPSRSVPSPIPAASIASVTRQSREPAASRRWRRSRGRGGRR